MQTSKATPQPRWRLSEERTQRKWSQQEVADLIGTTYVNISRWERGITRPNPYFRRKLCALFDKNEQELDLGGGTRFSASHAGEAEKVTAGVASTDGASSSEAIPDGALYDSAIPLQPAFTLIGRDNELSQIKQRLRKGGSVALTALNGLPGVGKTALSITLAHDPEIREHFRDGILWAGLGPHPNISGMLSRWGTLLGVSANALATMRSDEEWAKTLHAAIGTRSMLLVIDDAWTVEEALAMKVGGPNCAHLVTTRFPGIASHITVDGATVIHELDEHESIELLKKLAPGVVDKEEKKATDLVHAVGGLPLALTLMGNYLRKEAHSGKSRRIGAALKRLAVAEERLLLREARAPVERHTSLPTETPLSLQTVFEVTDQQLKEPERAALYALSVFPPKPNSFSEEAALAVADCTVETLDALSDTGLLESSGTDRYTLHQTIADYAHFALVGTRFSASHTAAYEKLIAFVISYVELHKKDYELLEMEFNMIIAALEAAQEKGKQAELVRGVNAFAPFLILRGLYELAEQQLQQALHAAQHLSDRHGITNSLLHRGEVAQKQGHYAQAEAYYQDGLALAREIQEPERISALLTNLGWASSKLGEFAQAEGYLHEGLSLARQIKHLERISDLLEMLGSVAGSRGDYAQSEAYLQEGLELARQVGDRERICSILINLGVTAGEQGHHTQELAYYQEGLALARQIRHHEWVSLLLLNLGDVVGEQGDNALAVEYFQEGLELARQIGHRELICVMLINLGSADLKQGNYAQAETHLHESLLLNQQIGNPQITANALYELGNLYLNQQQIEIAAAKFSEMLSTIPEGNLDLIAFAQYGLARSTAAKGNVPDARKLGEVSATALEVSGNHKAKEVREWLHLIGD